MALCRSCASTKRASSSLETIRIQTASGTMARELFQELSQTPAAMGSVRAALAIAALCGHIPKVRDAAQVFIQARIDGPDT